ncbi:peroxiredoxin family protein [Deinococcus marmoris]|uniref:peroxiredoxin family protein n=1 Tax=Deinococcus marmoris TaxID=249408 RepID=UPI0004982FFC|nr:peroxiredoxin family protein [Deinococcus marmoris]
MTATATQTASVFRLNNGDTFPHLSADLVGGGTLNLPADLAGSWGVVLFYRGNWCPFCRTQLSDFQKSLEQFAGINTKVVALSVDSQSEAQETVSKHGLTFPVAYGIDAQATAASVGNYVSDGSDGKPPYSHATGFVLSPDGKVAVALYSSSAIGRLNAADTLGLIKYIQSQT